MKRLVFATFVGCVCLAAPAMAKRSSGPFTRTVAMTATQGSPPLLSIDQRLLASHNRERLRLGLSPLTWSDQLSHDAEIWARHLAKTNSFDHAPEQKGQQPQGENLWMGTRTAYTPEEMVSAWIDEKSMFKQGKFPHITTTRDWQDVGHYSQLIWSTTTMVGCAVAANQQDDFLVCRYGPAGNWIGEDPMRALPHR